jgi:GWxTD domain-containing protein
MKRAGCLLGVAILLYSCSRFSRPELDPDSEAFYSTARLIMSKEESRIFTHLPDRQAREEFIQEFWEKRDPDPDTEENEFRQEFNRRVEYADQRFLEGIPGWKTDRGRIYIYFGEPDEIDRYPALNRADVKGIQIWYYYHYEFALRFVDDKGTGTYRFDPYYGIAGNFFEAVRKVKLGMLPRPDQGFRDRYADFKAVFSQRDQAVTVTFPLELSSGAYFLDITITGSGLVRTRKIFEFSVK